MAIFPALIVEKEEFSLLVDRVCARFSAIGDFAFAAIEQTLELGDVFFVGDQSLFFQNHVAGIDRQRRDGTQSDERGRKRGHVAQRLAQIDQSLHLFARRFCG